MKKTLSIFLSLIMILTTLGALPFTAQAAETLTVADGEATNSNIPFYGFYADAYTKSQYVIPAADLTAMTDSNINSLTCYTTSGQEDVDFGVSVNVYLTEVSDETISAFYDVSNATLVYSGNLQIANKKLNVAFDTPYHYNGGNLLVAFENTTLGTYKSANYLGKNALGASISNYSYVSLDSINPTNRSFIPKTTFTYEPAASSGEITVSDGTDIMSLLPFNPLYNYSKGQYIIPASDLSALAGKQITGLRWYYTDIREKIRNIQVILCETEETTMADLVDVSAEQEVFNGNWTLDGNDAFVTFDTPYIYGGGNLMVTTIDNTGDWIDSIYTFGTNTTTDTGYFGEDDTFAFDAATTSGDFSKDSCNFIPKTTFYVENAPATSGTIGDCEWNYNRKTKTLTISGEGAMAESFPMPYFDYKDDVETVVVEQGVTELATDAFMGFSKLSDVTLPAGLTKIGTFAFYNCPALTALTIPASVAEIGDEAIGRFWNDIFSRSESINGFVMKFRCTNEAAKAYAESNGIANELEHNYIEKNTPFNIRKKTDEKQKVYCKDCGNVLINATYPCPTDFKLSKTAFTYDGKAKQPTLSFKQGKEKVTIPAKFIKYKSNKKVGTATASYDFQNGNVVTLKFKINPKGTALTGVSKGKKAFTAKWKAQKTQTTGYELQYSTDKKFKKACKTVTVKKNKTVKTTVKKLKSGKTYYVRIRTYKTIGKTKYYSAWTKAKSVKVK